MGHPSAFHSITTVTGLPSTPARNPARHPQASLAVISQHRFQLGLEPLLVANAGLLRDHTPLCADEPGYRHGKLCVVGLEQLIVSQTNQKRAVDLVIGSELLQTL